MKKGNLEKWTNKQACNNLLFFSQLVNELLFDYSIPSNRVSTLNSHFLCLDALNAIGGIEYDGVPEGTLKPIVDELYSALKVDPIFQSYDNSPLNYFMKYDKNNGSYRISNNVSELNYEDMKKAVESVNELYFQDTDYYDKLKSRIIEIVISNDDELQLELFRLVKSLLTEIINIGYTPQYIYYVMEYNYWNPKGNIDCAEKINCFFDAFSLTGKLFDVVFIVDNNKVYKVLKFVKGIETTDTLSPRGHSHRESQFLRIPKNHSFISIKREGYDFYGAAEAARKLLSVQISMYRLSNHNYRYNINTIDCGVYEGDKFYRAVSPKNPTSHKKMPSDRKIKKNMELMDLTIDTALDKDYFLYVSVMKAIEFHSHSLDSLSIENQLLDLWAIFEAVLNISSKHTSDRIQQVCFYLVPILKRKYIYSLFEQLAADIKSYSEEEYERIVGDECDVKQMVNKVCEFTLLPEYQEDRDNFIASCADFPLLQERIKYYSQKLNKPKNINSFVEKHAARVRWQVMRIYRNRNLIIHNGRSMPYLRLLIENLHSYVDDFLEYVFNNIADGHTIESMSQELYIKECVWNDKFTRNKGELDAELIKTMLSF